MLDPSYLQAMLAEGIKLSPREKDIDLGVVDLVVALNRFGIKTESSCDGHGVGGVVVRFFSENQPEGALSRLQDELARSPDRWDLTFRSNTYRFPRAKHLTVKVEAALYGPSQEAFQAAKRLAEALTR